MRISLTVVGVAGEFSVVLILFFLFHHFSIRPLLIMTVMYIQELFTAAVPNDEHQPSRISHSLTMTKLGIGNRHDPLR